MLLALTSDNQLVFQVRSRPKEQEERDSFITLSEPGGVQQTAKAGRVRVWREGTNALTGTISTPRWLMLSRRGVNFSAFCSADGTNWNWIISEAVSLPDALEIGLAVTSFNEESVCTARFDQLSLQPCAPTASIAAGGGDGLLGTFTDGTNSIQRLSPTINFDWSYANRRLPGISHTNFSAVWTGFLEAPFTEQYAIQLVHDDCARLWLDGQLLIDDCGKPKLRQARAVAALEGGRKYPVRIEYQQAQGRATVKLVWSSPSIAKQVVPKARLYSAADLTNSAVGSTGAVLAPTLPQPWSSGIVGTTTNSDAAVTANGFEVAGGGGMAGRVLDEGRFLYQTWHGGR